MCLEDGGCLHRSCDTIVGAEFLMACDACDLSSRAVCGARFAFSCLLALVVPSVTMRLSLGSFLGDWGDLGPAISLCHSKHTWHQGVMDFVVLRLLKVVFDIAGHCLRVVVAL